MAPGWLSAEESFPRRVAAVSAFLTAGSSLQKRGNFRRKHEIRIGNARMGKACYPLRAETCIVYLTACCHL